MLLIKRPDLSDGALEIPLQYKQGKFTSLALWGDTSTRPHMCLALHFKIDHPSLRPLSER